MPINFDLNLSDPFGSKARSERKIANKRDDYNRDLAYAREDNAIQRRVVDANAAGLHPLAALGAQISSPVISQSQPANFSGGSSASASLGKPKLNEVDQANIKLLNKQADFIDEQIQDSRNNRIINSLTPDKLHKIATRIPGVDLPASDPAFRAQDEEDKYGEIADIDGALMRLIDTINFTTNELFVKPVMKSKPAPYRKNDPIFRTYD